MSAVTLLNEDNLHDGTYYAEDAAVAVNSTGDTIYLDPSLICNAVLSLTSGSPTTGARLEYSISKIADIKAGTGVFVSMAAGNQTESFGFPVPSNITAVRAVNADASAGVWRLEVRGAPRNP